MNTAELNKADKRTMRCAFQTARDMLSKARLYRDAELPANAAVWSQAATQAHKLARASIRAIRERSA